MNLTIIPRTFLVCVLILGLLLGMAPTAVAENQGSFIEYFLLGYLVAQVGYMLSPLDELNADIVKLKGDV